MKTHILLLFASIFNGLLLMNAQPLHQPIPNYTNNDLRVGHASYYLGGMSGYMENASGGIAATSTEHFLIHNLSSPSEGIAIEKKNAQNGTHIAQTVINIGTALGQAPSSGDFSRGVLLDPALNRIYMYGRSAAGHGFIICYNMSTLTPTAGFGTNGVQIIETGAEVRGLVFTGQGSNILAAINKGGTIILREYTSALAIFKQGTISIPNYSCGAYALKRAINGHYYLCGSATNTAGIQRPMIFDCQRTTIYSLANSSSPASTSLGTGHFRDFDFYVNTVHANNPGYVFDIIAVGDVSATGPGIYAKYIITSSPNYYTPVTTFTNQPTLPGNSAATFGGPPQQVIFTRCMTLSTGYTTVLGYYNGGPASARAYVGYLTPSGNQYKVNYMSPNPTQSGYVLVHKTSSFATDPDGNVLISGCVTGVTNTIIKLSNTYDCTPGVVLANGSSTTIHEGDPAFLEAYSPAPNVTMKWEIVSPNPGIIYQGTVISLVQYPANTTVYKCTIKNNATGCTSSALYTVNVIKIINPELVVDNKTTKSKRVNNPEQLNEQQELSIYPNPSNGTFTIKFKDDITTTIDVYDIVGKKMKSIAHTGTVSEMDLTEFEKGMYFINVNDGTNHLTEKIIIQ
jgi:hypothetical protein